MHSHRRVLELIDQPAQQQTSPCLLTSRPCFQLVSHEVRLDDIVARASKCVLAFKNEGLREAALRIEGRQAMYHKHDRRTSWAL